MPLNDKLFLLQNEVIKEYAEEGSCVIIGRCADYVLREEPNLFRIFIYGDIDHRQERVKARHPEIKSSQVIDVITKTDKRRASYYNFYTGNKWGKMDAIIKSNASEKVKYAAIAVFASDKEKNLLRTGQEFGVSLKLYAEVMNNADANGNGNVDSKEVGEYLRYMDLTWKEKAYLWQMICDGKDGKNNPFSTYFGEQFYHAAHINDPPEE
jgi:hypothetical protein